VRNCMDYEGDKYTAILSLLNAHMISGQQVDVFKNNYLGL